MKQIGRRIIPTVSLLLLATSAIAATCNISLSGLPTTSAGAVYGDFYDVTVTFTYTWNNTILDKENPEGGARVTLYEEDGVFSTNDKYGGPTSITRPANWSSSSGTWTTSVIFTGVRLADNSGIEADNKIEIRARVEIGEPNLGAIIWWNYDSAEYQRNRVPAQPSSITVPSSDADGSYSVSWGAATGASSYELQEKQGVSGSWVTIPNSGSPKSITGKTPGYTYFYQVRGVNSVASGAWRTDTTGCNVPHTVSTPGTPTVSPSGGFVGTTFTATASGSACNVSGHSVEYRFDWGDGTTSSWGSSSRTKSYSDSGTFSVKAQARCTTTTSIVSGWSSGRDVTVSWASLAGKMTNRLTSLAIASGTVSISGPSSKSASTDTAGNYTIGSIPIGSYSVTGSKAGYQNTIQSGVAVSGSTSFNVSLDPLVTITSFSVSPSTVSPGGRLTVTYNLYNSGSSQTVWLGASAQRSGTTAWLDDSANDKSMTVPSGNSTHARYFDTTSSYPAASYLMLVSIWQNKTGGVMVERYHDRQLANAFSVIAPGVIDVTVRNGTSPTSPVTQGAVVVLRDSGGTYVDNRSTDASGRATFSVTPASGYNIETFYVNPVFGSGGNNPPFAASQQQPEFWGSVGGISVTSGNTTSVTSYRLSPTVVPTNQVLGLETITVVRTDTGAVLAPGETIVAGTPLQLSVRVRNNDSQTVNACARLILDRSRSAPYDYDDNPSLYRPVPANSTLNEIKLWSPNVAGDYYFSPWAKVRLGNGNQWTSDSWGWSQTPLFRVAAASLPPGITIITHGFLPFAGSPPTWAFGMATNILGRADGFNPARSYGSIYVHDQSTGLWEEAPYDKTGRNNSDNPAEEIVLIYNWSMESDTPAEGWLEAAADNLFASLSMPIAALGSSTPITSSKPLHFIGHSRGAVLNSLVTSRIGHHFPSMVVDHVTTLDPHPAQGLWTDPPIHTYLNVNWADNYWREDQSYDDDFDGEAVTGAANVQLTEDVLNDEGDDWFFGHLEHSDVHAWYDATINATANEFDGLEIDDYKAQNWWAAGVAYSSGEEPNSGRGNIGYAYSRIAMGTSRRRVQNGHKEPPKVPAPIFNGTFDCGYTGWERHGGGGTAFVIGSFLQFGAGPGISNTRTHNYFYVPPQSTHLQFDYRIESSGANDSIRFTLLSSDNVSYELGGVGAESTSGWVAANQLAIPLECPRGMSYKLVLQLVDGSAGGVTSIVDVDSISLIDSQVVPIAPSPLSPNDGAVLSSLTPTLIWSAFSSPVAGRTQQAFQARVRSDSDGDTIVYEQTVTSAAASHQIPAGVLAYDKHYHWHVRVQDNTGAWSAWSADTPGNHQDFYTVQPSTVQFASTDYTVAEDAGFVRIYVNRSGGSYGAVSVNYATANGTATAGSDYEAASGTLNWANGINSDQFFDVAIDNDLVLESNESFTVFLSGASGATLGVPLTNTVTIFDDETAPVLVISTPSLTNTVSQGQNATNQSFEIWNSGGGTLYYTNAVSQPSWLSVAPTSGSSIGEHHAIQVTYSTTGLPDGSTNATITVSSPVATNIISVTMVVTPVLHPIIGVSGNLSFGEVPTNTIAQRVLTITNSGNAPLRITNVSYAPAAALSGTWSGNIPAGGAQDVTVSFVPTALTSYGSTVTVNSDATNGVNTLTGSGVGIFIIPRQLTDAILTNGVFSFFLNGSVGSTYVIQISSNLVNWLPFSTNSIPASGTVLITDSGVRLNARRYYRAVLFTGATTALVPVAHIDNGGYARSVVVNGDYAYLANEVDGLRVYDISNPFVPVNVGYTNTGSGNLAWEVALSGSVLYLANFDDGLRSYDVSNPTSPRQLGRIDNGGQARGIAVTGDYAYLANHSDGLRIYSITNPVTPVNVGRTNNGGLALRVAVVGNYAYLANDADGLRIYNISNPASPVNVGHTNVGGAAKSVAVSGNRAYVANGTDGLRIFDVSTPATPVPIGHINEGGSAAFVAVQGNYAFVARLVDGLRVYDISNPGAIVGVAQVDDGGTANGLAVAGNYVYLANDDDGLRIYRFTSSP